jgi:predicted O-linked N-acetylglucosamine transferase (SPINDLY family)
MHVADGVVHHRAGAFFKAEAAYREALKQNSDNVNALHLLSILSSRRGDLDEAETLVRKALALHPDSHEIMNTLAGVLASMGRHAEAELVLVKALKIAPDALKARANLLFLLNIIPDASRARVFAEHVEWGVRHTSLAFPRDDFDFRRNPDFERLRIGYVSADFCSHPVGRIMAGILAAHDDKSFEVFCYDNGSEIDEVNVAIKGQAEHWVNISATSDEELAARIRSDGIQILVDLSGHTRKHRLQVFALRPAPVQVTWLGYLNTTGIRTIDWRITDLRADPPPLAQQWHVERLWYLPDCLWTWEAPSINIPLASEPPCIQAGHVTFGSFNTFRKINDKVIASWSSILRKMPDARLRVHGAPRGKAIDRVYDLFEDNGVDPSRVDLFAPIEYYRYLGAYGDIDVSLDPFPYNGGATTCESLWMGVPVITLAGSGGFSRSGASLLGAMSLDEFVASTEEEYVDIAVKLACNWTYLATLRSSLREKFLSSPLSDSPKFARNLEKAYAEMWQDWMRRKMHLPKNLAR